MLVVRESFAWIIAECRVLSTSHVVVEAINSHRTVQTQEAMYLLMPTTANVERIIADFSNGRKQYGGAHVFFMDGKIQRYQRTSLNLKSRIFRITGLEEALCQRLLASPAAPYLRQLVDIFLNFHATEAKYFNLNVPETFFSLYSPSRDPVRLRTRLKRLDYDLRFAAKTVCVCPLVMPSYINEDSSLA